MKKIEGIFIFLISLRTKAIIKSFLLMILFLSTAQFAHSQVDFSSAFKKKITEIRKLRIEREKQKTNQTNSKTNYYNGMGGKISFTPKTNPYDIETTHQTIIESTPPSFINNFKIPLDDFSSRGIFFPPSLETTDNGVTWILGIGGNASFQPPILNKNGVFRRFCYPWDWQGNVTNNCGQMFSNNIYVNVVQPIPIVAPTIIIVGSTFTASDGVKSKDFCNGFSPGLQQSSPTTGGIGTFTHTWQKRLYPSGNWTDIATVTGGDTSFYVLNNLQDTIEVRKKIVDGVGTIAYSNIVRLNVWDVVTSGTIQPASQTIVAPSTTVTPIKFSELPTGGSGSFDLFWEYSSDTTSSATWSTVANFFSQILNSASSFSPPPSALTQSRNYRLKLATAPSGTGACLTFAYSNTVRINVTPCYTSALTGGSVSVVYDPYPYPGSCQYMKIINTQNVSGGGSTYTYLWEIMRPNETTWTNAPELPYISNPLYNNLPDYQYYIPANGTKYRRKVTDNCGNIAYSNIVTYYFTTNYSMQAGAIAASQTISSGNTPNLLTNATSPTYYTDIVWQSSNNGSSWSNIGGATQLTYQPPSLTQTMYYRRIAINNYCPILSNEISNILLVTVNPATMLIGGKISTSNSVIQVNTSTTINDDSNATGGTSPYNYSWQKNEGNGSWMVIAGETNATLNVSALTTTTSFKRKVIDSHGDSAFSNTITIFTQSFPIKPGIISKTSNTVCLGGDVALTEVIPACGGVGNITYIWEYNIGNGWVSIVNSNTPTLNVTYLSQNTFYRRKAIDEAGNFAYCNEVQVLVYPPIIGGTITPATQTICSNGSTFPDELKLVNYDHYTTGIITYQWQKATNINGPWVNIIGVTGSIYRPKISTQPMYYRVKATSTNCNMSSYSSISTVLVNNGCKTTTIIKNNKTTKEKKLY